MSALISTEVIRLLHRRLARRAFLVVAAALAAIAADTAVHSNRDLQAAQARAHMQFLLRCREARAQGQVLPICSHPLAHAARSAFYVDPRFSFAASIGGRVEDVAAALAGVGFLIGASAIGAEWTAGTFAGLLTFEPRRLRVLAAKVAAVVSVMVSAAALALGFEVGSCVVIAATRGTLEHTTGHLLLGLLWRCLRSLGLVAELAAGGAALAGLACSTAGALGAGIAYLVLDVVILRHVFPRLVPWVLSQDALAEVRGHASSTAITASGHVVVTAIGPARGGLELVAIAGALLAIWSTALLRRDVT